MIFPSSFFQWQTFVPKLYLTSFNRLYFTWFKIWTHYFPIWSNLVENDHVQPIIRHNDAEHIILHIGTNDLKYEKTPVQISHKIIELATKIRDKNIKVSVSSIIQRNDELNEKVLLKSSKRFARALTFHSLIIFIWDLMYI